MRLAHPGHPPNNSTGGPPSGETAHAAPALTAGQVVVVHGGPALAVQQLAAGVPDGVHVALLAERLQVPVDGGQADMLALAAQLGVDLLGTAEAGQPDQRRGQRLRLPGPARPRPAGRARGPGRHAVLRLRRGHSRTVQPAPPSRLTSPPPRTPTWAPPTEDPRPVSPTELQTK